MDILQTNWPIIVTLVTVAVVWGRHSQRLRSVEDRLRLQDKRAEKMAADLSDIKASVARVEALVESMMLPAPRKHLNGTRI